jgi:hypothetical protein
MLPAGYSKVIPRRLVSQVEEFYLLGYNAM